MMDLSSKTVSDSDNSSEIEISDDRGKWSHKIDYLLSLVGYCVGLGNLWRFPYICMRNGGGAFLIPYFFCLIFCGLPLYFLETAVGQFSGKGSMHIWEVCPLFKGVGIAMAIPMSICNVYYNTIIVWTLYYLGNSFVNPLPWTTCEHDWSSSDCVSDRASNTTLLLTKNNTYENSSSSFYSPDALNTTKNDKPWITAQENFWQNGVLQMSSGIDEIGHINWHLILCMLGAWLIVGLCIIRGVKSLGKVVYVTATLPYILLTIILVRGFLLDGSIDGVIFYLKPDFGKILKFQVWLEAAVQVFYSLGPGWGPLVAMSSFNKFNNNFLKDSILLTFICEGTSIYAGLVIFTVLGFMAKKFAVPIEQLVKSGPGLGFIVYPEALAQLPGVNIWSIMFFLMLLTVGLDSQFGGCESVILAFTDTWPILRRRRTLFTLCFASINILLGIIFCSQAGIYVFQLVDWYVVAFSLPLIGLIECIVFGWIYGTDRFSRDVHLMIGRGIPAFMRICICYITPFILIILFVCGIVFYEPPSYGEYEYPSTAIFFGFVVALISLVPIVVCAILVLRSAPGHTFKERLLFSLQPTPKWRPIDKSLQSEYEHRGYQSDSSLWEKMKLNAIGKPS